MRISSLLLAYLVLSACGGSSKKDSSSPAPQPPPANLIDDASAQTLLTTYCAPCHSGAKPPNGIVLDTTANAKSDPTKISKALKELTVNDQGQTHDMPPTDDPSTKIPTDAERAKLVSWFQQK